MGELPGHLSMMLVLGDKYHLEVHLGSHLGDHDALRVETFEFQFQGTWFSLPPRRDIGVSPRCRGWGSRLFSSASSPLTSVTSGWTWNGSSLILCQGARMR